MAWFDSNYLNRKKITIQSSEIGANESGFPVLIKRIDTDFSKARADGFDFVFTEADEVTEIPYERQRWIDSTGELVAWVKVDILAGTDVDIYIYYNYAGQTVDQQDPTNVWDSNYVGVYHMESITDLQDSTSSPANAVNNSATNSSQEKIGGAIDFDGGTTQRLDISYVSKLQVTAFSAVHVTCWIRPTSLTEAYPTVFAQGSWNFALGLTNTTGGTDGRVENWIDDSTNGLTNDPVTVNVWSQISVSQDGTNRFLYINGVEDNDGSAGVDNPTDTTNDLAIGSITSPTASSGFLGAICEMRISNIVRSINYMLTDFANQNSPATFSLYGSEESDITYHLAGVSRDESGAILGNCRMVLFKRDNVAEASRIYTIVGHQNSDGSGNYDFDPVADNDALYMVMSINQGSPIVRGCTNDNLQPIVV